MSIDNITGLPNFNQQVYDDLLREARAQGVAANQVDNRLVEAVEAGQSFALAADQAGRQLPRLDLPNGADLARIAEFGVVPSPGALVMSLVTRYAGEQREQNREVRHQLTEQIVESMQDEAKQMRGMAAVQLAMGIASGAASITGGILQSVKAGQALNEGVAAKSTAINAKGAALGQGASGVASVLKGFGDFAGSMYQAEMKEMQADQEKMREMRESVKDLDEGLKELIQKCLAAQDSIQQGQNQARAKILG
jgi:hypothetical protein